MRKIRRVIVKSREAKNIIIFYKHFFFENIPISLNLVLRKIIFQGKNQAGPFLVGKLQNRI